MKFKNVFKLTVAIAMCEFAGVVGSIFTAKAIPAWYAALAKPFFNPPAWIFAPVWTALYALMGISFFLIWSVAPAHNKNQHSNILQNVGMFRARRWAMFLFFIQLFLNTIWSIIFFGLQSPLWALGDIILLWIVILCTIIIFYKISKPAAYLLLPYLVWVSFAMYLNFSIWHLNI